MSYICTLCGYSNLKFAPWTQKGLSPSYEICPCCGVEFGVDDINKAAYEIYKKEWFESGNKWFMESKKPNNWNLQDQLKKISQIDSEQLPHYLLD
ncbi:hypothetical protein [Paenibacillus sp. SI8]|uniref:hypothetical protein n=1 Tax=unclassified Paenibacillus TaxID=185978 RepID=UPI003467D45A